MPLRAPNMYGFILGFQRLVWCPKWTPASSSCFIEISLIMFFSFGLSSPFLFSVTHRMRHHARDQKGCEIAVVARHFYDKTRPAPIVKNFNRLRYLCVSNKDKRCTQGSGKPRKVTGSWTQEIPC